MKTFIASLFAVLIAACGGGGSAPAAAPAVIQPKVVAFIGDSVVAGYQGNPTPTPAQIASGETFLYLPDQGYPALIQKASGGAIKAINYAVGGVDTASVYSLQYPMAVAAKPDEMVISTGVNDVRHGLPLQSFAQFYTLMLGDLQAKHIKAIVTTSIHYPGIDATVDLYMVALKRVAAQYGATVVDIRAAQQPNWTCSIDPHPCQLGYASIAQLFWPAVVGG